MAYSPSEKYPGAVDTDPDYQGGKFRDNNPSTTNNGSPLKAIDRNELLARDEAIMNDAGFEYNGMPDTPQDSQLFKAYKASLGNGANLLSNHNFLIQTPDDSQPLPSATPTSYPPGYQIFSGVFANETTGITNLTYIDGRVSFSGGDLYFAVPNAGGIERLTAFAASVADFDGKPRTRGVSFALVGDEYRVTVTTDALEDASANPTHLGSVKFEQGSAATRHDSVGNASETANTGDSQLAGGKIWPVENTLVSLGSQSTLVPSGVSILKVATGVSGGENLSIWKPTGDFAASSQTITNITTNSLGGYDVTTLNGSFEFVTQQVAQWRGQSFFYNDFTVDIRGWGALPSASAQKNTDAINAALTYLNTNGGGAITSSGETYEYLGAVIANPAKNITVFGVGWEWHWKNVATDGSHALQFTGPDFEDPVKGVVVRDIQISGNPQSGDGLRFDKIGRFQENANVTSVYRVHSHSHGGDAVQYGESTASGGGNKLVVESSLLEDSSTGVNVLGQSNVATIVSSTITGMSVDGVSLNQVASTNSVTKCFIADNARFGVYAFRAEQPIITYNAFNRNQSGAIVLGGDPDGSPSVKYTESALIMGNLLGDNGGSATVGERTEITVRAAKGTMIYCNYLYNTGKDRYVYISDYAEGYMIKSNWFKDFTTPADDAKKYVVKSGVINSYGVFDDDIDSSPQWTIYLTNKSMQYITQRASTLFQTKEGINDTASFVVKGDGTQEFGDGTNPSDVTVGRESASTYEIDAILNVTKTITMTIQSSDPTPRTGKVRVYPKVDGIYYVLPDGTRWKINATQV